MAVTNVKVGDDAQNEEDRRLEEFAETGNRTCRSCKKVLRSSGGLVRHIVLTKAGCKNGYAPGEVELMKKVSLENERAQRIEKGLQMMPEERSEKRRIRASQQNKRARMIKRTLDQVDTERDNPEKENGDQPRLVHPSSARKLPALEDPLPKGVGKLNIEGLDEMARRYRVECSKKKLQGSLEMVLGSSNMSNCVEHLANEERSDRSRRRPETFPRGFSLKPKVTFRDCENVEAFVAMALGDGMECVQVRYVMHRDDVTMEGLRDVMHVLQSVLGLDLYDIFSERQNVFYLNPANVCLRVARDRYCREILDAGGNRPEPPKPICFPVASRRERFVSPDPSEMTNDVPHGQLLLNGGLALADTAALGVQFRSSDGVFLAPLFSINMSCHWRFCVRPFADILTSWFGSSTLMNLVLHELPCVVSARNRYIHDLMVDCHEELQKPKEVSVCSHCGQSFEYNRYVLAEARRYHIHLQSHQLSCKTCGELFTNCQLRKFHERSHKPDSFYCPNGGCKYVGRSSKSVETHVRHRHTPEVCEHCGKAFKNRKCLNLHMEVFHQPAKKHVCSICERAYRSKNELEKHTARHNREGSKVDKWMNDDPGMYKYECTRHMTCKKYFKSVSSMRAHIRKYRDRDFPTNVSRFYRPDIPEGMKTIKDVELKENSQNRPEPRKGSRKAGRKKTRRGDGAAEAGSRTLPTEGEAATPAAFLVDQQLAYSIVTNEVKVELAVQQPQLYISQPQQLQPAETIWVNNVAGQQQFYNAAGKTAAIHGDVSNAFT